MEFFETSLVGAILGLVIGLILLIFGAERFTNQAEKIGHVMGLPEFVIGVVIVSMGTSLPELVASIFAVLKDAPTIVAGSVVGSNVTNTFFILGISFLFLKKSELKVNLIDIDLPFLLAATLLFVFMCIDADYNYIDGALSVFAAILYFVTLVMRNEELVENEPDEPEMESDVKHGIGPLTYVVIPVACVMIFFGGEWTVDAINNLSRMLKLDQSAIAGTAIAFAGSLPELFICARFAAQGKIEIALGNVVGASIINALFVMGVCSFFGPSGHLKVSADTINNGLPMMVAAAAIFIFVTIDRKVSKTEGGIFLIFYVFYLGRVLGVMQLQPIPGRKEHGVFRMIQKLLSFLKDRVVPNPGKKTPASKDDLDHLPTVERSGIPRRLLESTGRWEIKHTISGRIRLRNMGLYRNKTLCHIVEKQLTNTPGILSCTVRQNSCSVVITYNEIQIDTVRIFNILYITREGPQRARPQNGDAVDLSIGASSLVFAAIGEFAIPALMPVGALLLAYACLPDFKRGLRTILKERRLSAQLLAPIVLSSCILAGEIFVGAFMVCSFGLGRKLLERTYDNSQRLLTWSFEKQIHSFKVLRDGMEIDTPPDRIACKDVLVLQTGSMVPVDGIIKQGFGLMEQYLLTGDSQPTAKGVGDRVYHRSVLLSGPITMMVEKVGPDRLSNRIGRHLHAAMDYKLQHHHRSESLADKTVVPTLALGSIAAITGGISGGIAVANCNLGTGPLVSMPLSGFVAVSRCMECGILVKDLRKLKNLSEIDAIIFDENSLLDHRRLEVHRIITCGAYDVNRIVQICAAAEQQFSHPIAAAIEKKCSSLNLSIPPINTVQYHVGQGITAEVEGHIVHVGSVEFMKKQGVSIPMSMSKEMAQSHQKGYLLVMVGCNERLMGAVALRARQHRDVRRVLTGLRHRGIEHFAILSGDTSKATAALAEDLGIERYFSDVPPQNIPHHINLLKSEGRTVCFLGWGNGVAAASPDAHASISLEGLEGIDQNAAQLVFLKEDLTHLPLLFDISRDLERKIKRNRDYTLLSNGLCIAGVFFLGFGIWHSVIFSGVAMLAALMNNMRSIHKIADNKVKKALEMEMLLPVQETGLSEPLLTKASRPTTQAPLSSVSSRTVSRNSLRFLDTL